MHAYGRGAVVKIPVESTVDGWIRSEARYLMDEPLSVHLTVDHHAESIGLVSKMPPHLFGSDGMRLASAPASLS